MNPRPLISTLFPYTTLFRSVVNQEVEDIDNNNCAGVTTGVAVEMSLCFWQIRGKLCVDGFKPRLGVRSREARDYVIRSEEHTSELQSRRDLVCRLLLEKKKL